MSVFCFFPFVCLFELGSGMTVCLLGMAYFADIHHLAFFVIIQIFGGALQVWIDLGTISFCSFSVGHTQLHFL